MNATDPVNILATSSAATAGTKSRDQLDQKSFLRLMIAQFRNQDPTKPKDPSEFLGQLAQFSTVSGIQEMQGSIGALADSLRSTSVMNGAVLVGRDVLAPNADINFTAGERVNGALDAPSGATTVDVVIKDQAGQLIRRMTVPVSGGASAFSWDGVSDLGTPTGSGKYTVTATAKVGGASESVPVLFNTRVDSVTIDPSNNNLVLNTRNLGAVPIGNVRRIG